MPLRINKKGDIPGIVAGMQRSPSVRGFIHLY